MKRIIDEFVNDKNIAIIGVSRQKTKWGSMLADMLKKKGYNVYPVNPKLNELNGEKCYASIKDLPQNVENVIFATPSEVTEKIVMEDLPMASIKRVWMQKSVGRYSSESPKAINDAKSAGVEVVHGFCPMMFFEGGVMHGTHLFFRKLFGNIPEDYKLSK